MYIKDSHDEVFQNEAGYTVSDIAEIAELLETGQILHTVNGERYHFCFK